MTEAISPGDPNPRQRMRVLDSEMAYVDVGEGDPVIFLHGNPTSSFLWRNVIPHVQPLARCLAPDLIGMGDSGPSGTGEYRFADHARYLDAWIGLMDLGERITFVVHDWGSALGFGWGHRNQDRVAGYAYMEAIVMPVSWEQWPPRRPFERMRGDEGERLVLEENYFVERILPSSVLRGLTDEEMAVYRRPYEGGAESRRPTLTWPREIPIAGEPADVVEIVRGYGEWLAGSDLPKLFINADPGAILVGDQREFCRSWPNQREVTVHGSHFIQEDSPHEIGEAIAAWYRESVAPA